MKIIFGFNDIRPDGMGSEAVNLMRTLKKQGIVVQPVHAWNKILLPGYVEEFHPIFVRDQEDEPALESVIKDMVSLVNEDSECNVFSHFGSPNWACVIPYLRNDIRVVVSVHSITPSALKIALAYKERVSAFIAISWGIQNKLKKKLRKNELSKIALITNAIDTDLYCNKKVSRSDDIIKIVFFGRIEDYTKGCDKIPQIAHILKKRGIKFMWDFYGYFHWGYENRFYLYNDKYDVSDVIRYKGCLNPEEIPEVLNEYDVMVMPSNHEGFGLALAEAMSVGLACVASRIENVTDMIMDSGKEGILVGRNDIKGFADAIEFLANSKNIRLEYGNAARHKVINKFSLKNQGLQYKELLFEICSCSNYSSISNVVPLDQFKKPSTVKSHILARILPVWIKRILKKIV